MPEQVIHVHEQLFAVLAARVLVHPHTVLVKVSDKIKQWNLSYFANFSGNRADLSIDKLQILPIGNVHKTVESKHLTFQ